MVNKVLLSIILILSVCFLSKAGSQTITKYSATPITVSNINVDWQPNLVNLEMPVPGGNSYQSFLLRQKQQLSQYYRNNAKKTSSVVTLGNADLPLVMNSFKGNAFDGSVPTDNDLAISNDGKLISVANSSVNFYDMSMDSLLFTISLEAFFDTLGLPANKFDPKVIYDPKLDKFIMIALSGNTDSTSNIVVAFSETNNPLALWNMYALPGNYLSNGTWSDYPMVAITDDELFITVNTLINDTVNTPDSWKFLFVESIVWQINKQSGHLGDSLITRYHTNIKFEGKPIRNLCPIQGGATTYGPNIYLLSNRNFDIENDTFFILGITGTLDNPSTQLQIDYTLADITYGLAPDGKQKANRLLQTNDSRVLGGYLEDEQIHFVQNSVNPDTLRAAIYHGILTNLNSTKNIEGAIIGVESLDFGYPNIAYTGKFSSDDEAIITFNHTSVDSFAGFSAVFYDRNVGYSARQTLKPGEDFVAVLNGLNQRWGDYSGTQRKYDEPGKVWVAGFYGERVVTNRINSTWIAELTSPDTSLPLTVKTFTRQPKPIIYPNPSSNIFSVEFEIETSSFLEIVLIDVEGREIKTLLHGRAKKGINKFSFSLNPLPSGNYFLLIKDQSTIISSSKIIKY